MAEVLVALVRRGDTTREEYRDYYEDHHGPFAAEEIPHLEEYFVGFAADDDQPFDSVARLVFDSVEDAVAALESDEIEPVLEDAATIADLDEMVVFVAGDVVEFEVEEEEEDEEDEEEEDEGEGRGRGRGPREDEAEDEDDE